MRGHGLRIGALSLLTVLAVQGCDQTKPNPVISITLGTQTLSIIQGQNVTVAITLARSDFDGDVSLTASGLPSGVTATFNPATLSGAATSSTLTLALTNVAAPGAATIKIDASGTGVETASATLALTVTVAGSYTLAGSPASVSVGQGGTATSTINITRSGGFAQNVALAASGLPAGVTAAFNPASAGGASSTLTFTAAATAATGTSMVTVTGTTPGLPNQTATISLTVSPPGTSLSIDFCSGSDTPLWFAYQNEGAAWTRVIPDANGTVSFVASAKVGIAFVQSFAANSFDSQVYYVTAAELQPVSGVPCVEQGTKSLNGSVSGLTTGQNAFISMGYSGASATPTQTSFTLQNVASGALDLVATRQGVAVDRIIIRRALDRPTGSTLPVLDFLATEALSPVTANFTFGGLAPGESNDAQAFFITGTNSHAFLWSAQPTANGTLQYLGVPGASTVSGDLHELFLFASSSTAQTSRGAFTVFRTPADKSLTLGAALSIPSFTQAATSPYVRFRAQMTSQADYGSGAGFEFRQENAGREAHLFVTSAFHGGTPTTWDVTIPDFSAVSGWQNTWGLQTGQATNLGAEAYSRISFMMPGEGTTTMWASREATASTSLAFKEGQRAVRSFGPLPWRQLKR